ncbi:MAG TPA: HU family DNA-binding protein [Gammaproteobacteria bacterium]|jgi:nucleoid DNA-binding protein|nr:HU family DNA-binding protein [Gammaproteobacteria bacterium]
MPVKKKSKATKKKASNGKSATKLATKKLPSIKDPLSKKGVIDAIVSTTGLSKKDVTNTLICLNDVIEKHIKSGGPGTFTMPGLLKIMVKKKPARPARKGINPFTGEEVTFKAKPACKVVKIKPLKKLKEMVA